MKRFVPVAFRRVRRLTADVSQLCCIAAALALCGGVFAQQTPEKPVPAKAAAKVYPTGRVAPKNLPEIKKAAYQRNGHLKYPKVTAPSWDSRTLGIIPPVKNQANCGSCWDFSGSGVVTVALIKAGQIKNDGTQVSEQFILDCSSNGGCNGDDNTTVLAFAKSTGMPTDADYGPYNARPGRCKSGLKLLKIKDWGFADGGQGNGVTPVQQIKDAIAQYGCVGAAIAADDRFMNVRPGEVFDGNARDINHDIILCGWDDAKGAWLLRNSWGTDWCDGGYCWIKYGANSVGTEAVWAVADSVGPPTGPNPPPGNIPVITSPLAAAGSVGAAFSYQIAASGSPTAYAAAGLPAGLSINTSTGLVSGTPQAAGTSNVTVIAANSSGAGTATLVLTVGTGPAPGGVTITLTPEQVKSVISQSGAVVITKDMTIGEVMEKLAQAKAGKPCCGAAIHTEPPIAATDAELQAIKRGVDAILKYLLAKEAAK